MQKNLCILFLFSCLVITACGEEKTTSPNKETNGTKGQQTNEEAAAATTEPSEEAPVREAEEAEEAAGGEKEEVEAVDAYNYISEAEDLMHQVQQAMADITSMSMDIQSERTVSDNGKLSTNFTAITGEISFEEPMAFHQTIVIEGNESTSTKVEMYRVKDHMYMSDSASEQWVAFPLGVDEQEDVFMMDPTKQVAGIESLNEAFSLSEEGDEYILTYTGNTADFEALIQEAVQLNEDPVSKRYFDATLDSFEFLGDYQIKVDKDTFYLTTILLEYESALEAEKNKTTVQEKLEIHYDDFNEHDHIEVPEEVTANAQTFGEE